MTLIDSSAWINYLKGRGDEEEHWKTQDLIRNGKAAMCPIVWAELWQGARGKREDVVLEAIRQSCHWVDIDGQTWDRAYALGRKARRTGLNCPFSDVIIVACAQIHGIGIVHDDKHIEALLKL